MSTNGDGQNGHGSMHGLHALVEREKLAPAPARVQELAQACVQYVKRSLGVELDYEAETVPLLDHYVEEGRRIARERPEAALLIAHAAGAYFGEVVRRRHSAWWRAEGDDPADYRIELGAVYLSFSPVRLIAEAMFRDERPVEEDAPIGGDLVLEEQDRDAVAQRLADLPAVSEDEYYAPSTRLEVIDIAVDAIRARRMGEGEPADSALGPADYDDQD